MRIDWTKIELFKGIDLNDSFVLGWNHDDNDLSFEIEASIWPESEHYLTPKKDEFTCYRKATMSFRNVESITGLKSVESVRSTTDPDGSKDYGNIDSLKKSTGGFEIAGEFGLVQIKGGVLHFEISD